MSMAPQMGLYNKFAACKSPSPAVVTDMEAEEDDEIDDLEVDTPPEVDPPKQDLLGEIIALQTFEGWWKLDDGLLKILELSRIEAEKHLPGNVSLEMWATVLAICFLEGKLSDQKDAWELVVEKARGWFDGQGVTDDVSVEFFDVAGGLVGC